MAFVYFNPNPKHRRTSDCTVRALCRVLDMDWEQAYINLFSRGLEMAEMPEVGTVFKSILRDHGFKMHVVPDTCPDCYTVMDFAEDHPEGIYVVAIDGKTNHVVAVVSKNWYDTWDSGDEIVSWYMRKER
ncbi:MAG: hypothetical protein IJR00_07990 [Lachnospiraceae bacterium]|nr:hypothetical protein [Lachnospiraceae bacterium]